MDYIGFYWTLPVPWAGFTALPSDPDAAAKASRTIRYQLERVRRWVKDDGGRLVAEEVFLELAPDRGTGEIVPVIDRLIAKAHAQGAKLVLVDFSDAFQWRRHGALWDRLADRRVCERLDPTPIFLDGKAFDPVQHFRSWRQLDQAHAAARPAVRAALAGTARSLRDDGSTYAAIAAQLNASGDLTPNGRKWTADNVRKLLAAR